MLITVGWKIPKTARSENGINVPKDHIFWAKNWNICPDKHEGMRESSQIQLLELRPCSEI